MASYSNLKPLQVKDKPFENIGADDVCSIETNHKGFLRKEGKIERSFHKLVQKYHVNWRRYFAVLSQGCVYVFRDEHAATPKIKFSLLDFRKLKRNDDIPHSFDILPSMSGGKVYRFCCDCDSDRLEWMRALYVSLLTVHKEPLPSYAITKHLKKHEEYNIVESPIGMVDGPDDAYEIDDGSSSDDDRYDKPDEDLRKDKNKYVRDPTIKDRTLPDIPVDSEGVSSSRLQKSDSADESGDTYDDVLSTATPNRSLSVDTGTSISGARDKRKPKPMMAPKPNKPGKKPKSPRDKSPRVSPTVPSLQCPSSTNKSPINNAEQASYINNLTEDTPKADGSYLNIGDPGYVAHDPDEDFDVEYMFSGTKLQAASELHLTDTGTFLIRDSSEPNAKVLVVQLEKTLVSYKCYHKDDKIFIDANSQFKSYHELVEHYKKNPLPNRSMKLIKGFNVKDPVRPVTVPVDGAYEPVEPKMTKPR